MQAIDSLLEEVRTKSDCQKKIELLMLPYTGLSEDRMPQNPMNFIFQGIVGISLPISTVVIPSAGCLFSSALARM